MSSAPETVEITATTSDAPSEAPFGSGSGAPSVSTSNSLSGSLSGSLPNSRPDSLAETERRLVEQYARDGVAPDAVRAHVADARGRLADARISAFLPILLERAVRRAL